MMEGQARIAHATFESMRDEGGIGIQYCNALLNAGFAHDLVAQEPPTEAHGRFLHTFIGMVTRAIGPSFARQIIAQGQVALDRTAQGIAQERLTRR